jgi:hypothetical protein
MGSILGRNSGPRAEVILIHPNSFPFSTSICFLKVILLSNTTPRSVIESTCSKIEEPIAYEFRVGLKDLVNVMVLH